MTLTRRTAVRLGIAAPFAVALSGVASPSWAAARSPYDRATWAPYVGSTFTMSTSAATASVVLESLTDLSGSRAGAPGCFSLVFRSAATGPTGFVTFRRKGFADATLFVAAVDRSVAAHHYQAVVNRPS
jgi:hypothetical protein